MDADHPRNLESFARCFTGIGIWLAARRLHQGKFAWPAPGNAQWQLESAQLEALVLGLPWQRMGDAGIITRV